MGKQAQGMAGSASLAGQALWRWPDWRWRMASPRFGRPPLVALLAEVALLGSVAALLAMLGWVLLAPLRPATAGDNAGLVVLDAPARAALFAQFDPFARDVPDGGDGGGGGAAGAALPFTLLGTRSTVDGQGGGAILVGADGVQRAVPQGADIAPGVRLVQVAFDHVVLQRAGGTLVLRLAAQDGRPADSTGGKPPAPRFRVADAAHGAPGLVASGAVGEAQSLGLLPGDRIVALRGKPVRDARDARQIEAMLAAGQAVAVTVRRAGHDLALSLGPAGGGQ
ncbi:type II secretion system protein N [Novosphingobium capsulatum]|uniref:type II secretion system protein N n=2 Tax=Novosphingobium capsulatum TaxID=13688 RepID=UPI000787398E|nr:type II secretion system protein N [Novosphingobium capsulatum]WQD94271.1 type II secretion system protein N [Novosphingobium capsulatum]